MGFDKITMQQRLLEAQGCAEAVFGIHPEKGAELHWKMPSTPVKRCRREGPGA